jgi:SsrA-binding protein
LVPLRLYVKRGHIKVELGLAKGKHLQDKRETIKRRTADREAERAVAARIRGR